MNILMIIISMSVAFGIFFDSTKALSLYILVVIGVYTVLTKVMDVVDDLLCPPKKKRKKKNKC